MYLSRYWLEIAVASSLLAAPGAFSQTEPPPERPPLEAVVDAAIDVSAVSRQTYWGIQAVQLSTGKVLAAKNPKNWFVPASNAKLFSTALALSSLGPHYTFNTVVSAPSKPTPEGLIRGDVVLRGGGDPTLSGRTYPYRQDAARGDPLQAIDELADQVVESGVRRIEGDIVGDDTRYEWEPYPEGWAADDEAWDYGAGVSALVVNDSSIRVVIRPGRAAGELARISVQPSVECVTILNQVRTTAARGQKVEARRAPNSTAIELYGGISLRDGAVVREVAAGDPAEFAACLLEDALRRRGVEVEGAPRARHRWPGGVPKKAETEAEGTGFVLARRTSPPLEQIVAAVNKESLNLHAEMLLCEAGLAAGGEDGRQAGLKAMNSFLAAAGVPDSSYDLEDASGLSRLALVTPEAVTRLLAYMAASPQKDAWLASLAVGGEDGTLEHRFTNLAAGRLRAKTGTLTHVSALAGYAESATYGTVAFSILANNYNAKAGAIRPTIDRIVSEILR